MPGELLFGGSGAITFVNGTSASTVVGSAGPLTAFTGLGGGAYFGSASGGNTLVAQGGATVLAAAGSDQVDLDGSGNLAALGSGRRRWTPTAAPVEPIPSSAAPART